MATTAKEIRRILVVSRMTPYCQEAVRMGASLARQYGAELYLIHVIHNPFGIEGWNLPLPSLEKDYQKLLQDWREEMVKMVAAEKAQGLEVIEMLKEGDPVDEVITAVKEHAIDLMIMLAHTESRLEHLLFGRDNDELVRRLPCSIMLVKKEPESVDW